jgi:hypothetical protein
VIALLPNLSIPDPSRGQPHPAVPLPSPVSRAKVVPSPRAPQNLSAVPNLELLGWPPYLCPPNPSGLEVPRRRRLTERSIPLTVHSQRMRANAWVILGDWMGGLISVGTRYDAMRVGPGRRPGLIGQVGALLPRTRLYFDSIRYSDYHPRPTEVVIYFQNVHYQTQVE